MLEQAMRCSLALSLSLYHKIFLAFGKLPHIFSQHVIIRWMFHDISQRHGSFLTRKGDRGKLLPSFLSLL
jgi:hypothetical protein